MEASAKRLKERCAGLLAGARKYREGLTAMTEAQMAFAAALNEFGGGDDEESLHLGSAVMSQFIKVFRELAGFYDFLRTQVRRGAVPTLSCQSSLTPCRLMTPPPAFLQPPQLDLGLIERVQQDWVDGVLAAQREERRRYDRRSAEYDAAR
jgi:hypothetical protein